MFAYYNIRWFVFICNERGFVIEKETIIKIKDSDFIDTMFFVEENSVLYIYFKNGSIYQYKNVTSKEFSKFSSIKEDGSAVGKLFSSKIKDFKKFIKL